MNTYYLNIEQDGFGEWGDYPQDKIDEAIKIWAGIATRKIEEKFPRTIVETTTLSGQNSEDTHPDFEWIDDFLSRNWIDWLEEAVCEVDFGFIVYKNQKYIFKEQPFESNRVMNEYSQDLQYQGNGDTYMDEWMARAYDQDHNDVIVKWHFEIGRENCEELPEDAYAYDTLPEDYDWDNVHNIEQ